MQRAITIPKAKITMKDGEEIIVSRESGMKLQEALANTTQHLFVNIKERGRSINTTELKDVDTTYVETRHEDVKDEELIEAENRKIRSLKPEERAKLLGRFKLHWMRVMRPVLGYFPIHIPEDVREAAEKLQLEYYKKHSNATDVPLQVFEDAGLFDPSK